MSKHFHPSKLAVKNIFIRLHLAAVKKLHVVCFQGVLHGRMGPCKRQALLQVIIFRKFVFNCYRSPLFCIISSFVPSYKFPLTKFSFQIKSQDVTIELLKSNIERNILGMECYKEAGGKQNINLLLAKYANLI